MSFPRCPPSVSGADNMAEFNPIRAAAETLAGIEDALAAIRSRRHDAQRRMDEAEAEYNALVKIEALAREIAHEARGKLDRVRAEAEGRTNYVE